MSSPISSPPTSRTLSSLSSCHVGFEIPTCGLSDSLTRFGSLRSGWSLITLLPFTSWPLICYSIRIHRAVRLPTHICSSLSLEKRMKEIKRFEILVLIHPSAWKGYSRKFVCRILDNLQSRRRHSSSEPQPRRVAWHNILEACIKMRFFGCSTTGEGRRFGTHS